MEENSPKEVERMLAEGKILNLIDVREAAETAGERIKEAVNIPLGLLEFRMNELDKSKEYVLICRSGARSSRAAQFLEYQGFKVKNMTGGMLAWEGITV